MTAAYTLGIDPGQTGAAVLLDPGGRRAVAVWSWTHRPRKGGDRFEVHQQLPEPFGLRQLELLSLFEVSYGLIRAALQPLGAPDLPYHLVCEGLFVWPGHDCGFDTLAEATGEVLGPLRDAALSLDRPLARRWRSVVLPRGWGRTSEEAERAALTVCRGAIGGLEGWLETEQDGDGRVRPRWPHVVEAGCLARFGHVTRAPAQMALAMGRGR